MNWQDLSMSEKSDLMSLYIRNGISSLEEIKKHYNSFATGGHLYYDGGPDDDKYSFLRREPEVAVADNTRYVRPVSDVEIDRASGLPEGTTTMRRIISAQADRQQPVIKQDNVTNETHKSINKEVKKAQTAKKVNDVANAVAAVTSIPATVVAPEVMTPIFALQGFNDATDVLSKEESLNTEDYGRLGLDALFMLPMFNTAGNYLRFNTNLGRSYELSRALNKSIRNIELPQRIIESPSNNRFRLGDVEINDPNLMYRQTDGRALGEVASGGNRHTMFNRGSLWYGIPTESMLNPVIEPKTVGKLKLTKPNSEVAKTHLLVTRNADMTGANQKFGRVSIGPHSESSLHLNIEKSPEDRWLNEMIREWRNKNSEPGVATYVTDGGSRRVPLEGALNNSNTSIYTFDSGYGYRRIQEPTPTLEQAMQEAEDAYVRNNPLAFVHEIEDMQLLNTIREFNGRRGSPSLGISRFDANGNAYTGYGNVRFYFPKEYIKGLKSYSWSDDALLPTTSDAIREAERRGIKLQYTEDGEALISPELESQLKIELLKNHPHLNKRDKNLETSIKNIRAINSPSHYGEVFPLEPVDLSKALYVQTSETYPTLTNWLKLNGIQYGTKVPAILDKRVTFKNGGKLE